jgi:hypothetical protein
MQLPSDGEIVVDIRRGLNDILSSKIGDVLRQPG